MSINISRGKDAVTNYQTIEFFSGKKIPDMSFLECRLETGRTHQIRVHLSSHGNPIIGDQIYGKQNKFIREHRLEENVKIVSHESFMPSAYNACNLVLSASIEPEAFGRVAVEAQAMEKPILASNIGGSNETIIDGQTGWLFKSDDEKDLAKMIIEISKKDKSFLKDLGAKGRANVINNYTVDQMCSKTLEIYKSLV